MEEVVTICAVCSIQGDEVINKIIALPSDDPPDGCYLAEIMNGQSCDIGWRYDGINFIEVI